MLVEINLLPQKEQKKSSFIIALSCLLVIMLLVGGYYLWKIDRTKTEVASLDQQITMAKKVVQNQEQSNTTFDATNSASQLKSAIEWADEYPIQTIPVMRHLTSLLPERGFIQSFGYTEAGTITLSVQFDSAREAAYFLDNLNDSKWIEEASLNSLATSSTGTASTNTTNNQTSPTGSPTNSTNQADTTNSTANTTSPTGTTQANTNTTNQGSITQDTSGSTVNMANQTSTVNGSSSQTQTTTNTASNSTATTSNQTSTITDTNILPRYTGQFEIKLDKDYVKKAIKKSKTDEEGVTGS